MADSVVIVGNCQAQALAMMLATNDCFQRRFDLVEFPPVHELPPELVPSLHEAVATAAVAILQRIEENYRDGLGLGTATLARIAGAATVIRWPSLYWGGYFPDLFYFHDAAGRPVVDGPFDYHDRLILQAYADGLTARVACGLMEDRDRPSDAESWAEHATAELARRESECDIRISEFVASRFRERLLFFTMNHPTNLALSVLADEILSALGIDGGSRPENIHDEILGPTFYPLHANHVRTLGLRFGEIWQAGSVPFRIRGVTYEPLEAVGMFFDYYAQHPELVALNGA